MRKIKIIGYFFMVGFLGQQYAYSQDNEAKPSIKQLSGEYRKTNDKELRKNIRKRFKEIKPTTNDDVLQLRKIFADKDWDEEWYSIAMNLVPKIDNPQLANGLIPVLSDEKNFIKKVGKGDPQNPSDKRTLYRLTNTEWIIRVLGKLKNKDAVPILKEYLNFYSMQYAASEALGEIGDKSMSEEIREKAYRGEPVNYSGLGLDEAKRVVRDLDDNNNKDKWVKISKQLLHMKDPRIKPELKKLFSHDNHFVRVWASMAFARLADSSDVMSTIEMSKNPEWNVRVAAIDMMKKLRAKEFEDVLINLLNNDSHRVVRLSAAKAIGYKKVTTAVPHLEKALKDKEIMVREEVYIALYVLTGKKYPCEGKTPLTERRAEHEKQHPSFY
ncbi:MAG: HEAT repeat domain-containing protein [Elusimicrobia bacterium]|nr:HEAT repeat domain-containing protein [Elusimicrobiota bacterium]